MTLPRRHLLDLLENVKNLPNSSEVYFRVISLLRESHVPLTRVKSGYLFDLGNVSSEVASRLGEVLRQGVVAVAK